MRIGIVTDSNSGITQAQAARMGVFVLPMPFTIDGQDYFEDISLTQQEFYEKLREGSDIATSQPSPEAVMNLWDQVLGEYDQVVHIPMSSALSGSCQTARMLGRPLPARSPTLMRLNILISDSLHGSDMPPTSASCMLMRNAPGLVMRMQSGHFCTTRLRRS